MKKYLSIMFLILYADISLGVSPSDNLYNTITQIAMNNFWDKARLKDGSFVTPKNEKERKTIPINKHNIIVVIDAGKLSGKAAWCDLNWKDNYFKITNNARQQGFSGKQVAFTGLLHGVSMGLFESSLKDTHCTKSIKKQIQNLLQNVSNKSFHLPVYASGDFKR